MTENVEGVHPDDWELETVVGASMDGQPLNRIYHKGWDLKTTFFYLPSPTATLKNKTRLRHQVNVFEHLRSLLGLSLCQCSLAKSHPAHANSLHGFQCNFTSQWVCMLTLALLSHSKHCMPESKLNLLTRATSKRAKNEFARSETTTSGSFAF